MVVAATLRQMISVLLKSRLRGKNSQLPRAQSSGKAQSGEEERLCWSGGLGLGSLCSVGGSHVNSALYIHWHTTGLL